MNRRSTSRSLFMIVAVSLLAPLTAVVAGAGASAADVPAFDGTRTETFTVGPYALNPQGEPGDQVEQFLAPVDRPDGDIAVRSIEWELVDGSGNPLSTDQAHLHHLVLLDTARSDELCSVSSRFASTGAELTDFDLPEPYAFRSPEGGWQGVYHLMNRSDAPLELTVQYTVTYSDARSDDYIDVEPMFLDVDGCWGDSEFVVPGDGGPGSAFSASNQYTMNRDATIVSGGGHLHSGGIDVTLSEVGGHEICRSAAIYGGHHGHLASVESCGELGEDVEIGDVLDITARYRNDAYIPDAMGIMVMYFEFTSPPPPPPTVEITSVEFRNGALEVTAVCNSVFDVSFYGSIQQTKGKVTVYGYPQEYGVTACGPDGVTTSLDVYGDGVLTGGAVEYDIDAYGYTSDGSTSDFERGTTRLRGRVVLDSGVSEQGDLDIVIDPEVRTDDAGTKVVTVDVPCVGGEGETEVSVTLRQRAGRQFIVGNGYAFDSDPSCVDGFAQFTVAVDYVGGRFVGGPAVVAASVYRYGASFEYSTRIGAVRLSGSTPPANATDVVADPDSRVKVTDVTRRDGAIVIGVTLSDCVVGATVYLDASVTEIAGKGRRTPGNSTYAYNQEALECIGGSIDAELTTFDELAAQRVVVNVFAYESIIVDGVYQEFYASNAAEFRVRK